MGTTSTLHVVSQRHYLGAKGNQRIDEKATLPRGFPHLPCGRLSVYFAMLDQKRFVLFSPTGLLPVSNLTED